MPIGRGGFAAAVVKDKIYVFGGIDVTEEYTPIGYYLPKDTPPDDTPPEPSPDETPTSEPFPTVWIASAVVTLATSITVLLVYLIKVRKITGKVNNRASNTA